MEKRWGTCENANIPTIRRAMVKWIAPAAFSELANSLALAVYFVDLHRAILHALRIELVHLRRGSMDYDCLRDTLSEIISKRRKVTGSPGA